METNKKHFQSVVAYEFFVRPADTNYLLARMSKIYSLNEEFWWQSLQCVEKLLKATLITNGASAKKHRHGLLDLWKAHKDALGEDAVNYIEKPSKLNQRFWKEAPIEEFIRKVDRMGSSDSRYGLVSHYSEASDLHKLDQLVKELRKRTVGMDWVIGENFTEDTFKHHVGMRYSEAIKRFPDLQIRRMIIPSQNFEITGSTLLDMHHSWNFAFTRDDSDIEKSAPSSLTSSMGPSKNSLLYTLWEIANGIQVSDSFKENISWLLDNVKIGHEVEKEFRRALNIR